MRNMFIIYNSYIMKLYENFLYRWQKDINIYLRTKLVWHEKNRASIDLDTHVHCWSLEKDGQGLGGGLVVGWWVHGSGHERGPWVDTCPRPRRPMGLSARAPRVDRAGINGGAQKVAGTSRHVLTWPGGFPFRWASLPGPVNFLSHASFSSCEFFLKKIDFLSY